ncbi:malignant fibrous histiocytoma-amplified sequence 1 homolog isoform X1 [Chiloscyllium plagiosum]|uniref:malignant fibrous histiocytoma-amplified sequence 1 homolog isoform X1 n=1 Tax=Chiloscyllium plagiosum TaxID=36176 RepID=UPI001CB82DEF|nr:malignant fibrous histiocytoma-amplified sequence 1 homolog isoform X1 [Chiloscyllium plagiosum]
MEGRRREGAAEDVGAGGRQAESLRMSESGSGSGGGGGLKTVRVWREAARRCRKLRGNWRQLSASGPRLSLPSDIGHVQVLNLANNSLLELPDGLDSSLSELRALILRRNRLRRLPSRLCGLPLLDELDLAHNCLAALPAELGALGRLRRLCLSHNKLQQLPPEIGGLSALEELDVSFNELRQLPASLGLLARLRALDVDHNRLSHFPPQILQLAELEELDLSGNQIRALPRDIPRLRSVKILWLSSLRLSALPDTFCGLAALESLMLDNNGLRAVPERFGELRRLKMINLSSNRLEEFPGALLQLTGLEELYLSRNELSVIPAGIAAFSNLAALWLDNNKVRFLPDSIVELSNLEELVLQGNQIAILPDSFGSLSKVSLWKIKDNPLIQPPYEVCMKGIPYIAAYQKELALSQPAVKPRLKLVLMGSKGAGKTSLRQCLVGNAPGAPATHAKGIEVTQWVADAEKNLTFIVYDLAGDQNYDLIQPFFLSPGALYVLVVSLRAYAPDRFYELVGYFLHLLGARVPHGVVCVVGAHVDQCNEKEVEEKCLDIHHQIALQEKRDVEFMQAVAEKVDGALGQEFDLRATSPHAPFYGVSDKNLRRKKAQVQYLLNNRLQILSPVITVSCQGDHVGITRLKEKLLSVAEHREIFPNLHRVLPKSWQRLEELHYKPQELWLSWWDSARLGLQAGLTEDRLQSALSYLHESGKLLYFEDSLTLKECVFHNLTKLIDILNVFFQRDASVLLQKLLADANIDELRATQLHHYVEGFLLHGLLPLHIIRLLLKPHIKTQQDLHLILELLEKMGLCYCLNKPKITPINGVPIWFKFPCYVKNEVPHAEAWINGSNLSGQQLAIEQLQVEYSFPFLFPPGLFPRYSVQINSHVVHRSDGKYQIFAYRGKVPVVISYRPTQSSLQADTLSIASHASLPNIWTAWQAIIPLMEELNVLLQEWPGLYFTVHVLCSKCLKRGSSNPHTFPGELLTQSRPEGVTEIICPKNGSERVDVALVYPPTPTVISPCC